jgi:hypothetical protein
MPAVDGPAKRLVGWSLPLPITRWRMLRLYEKTLGHCPRVLYGFNLLLARTYFAAARALTRFTRRDLRRLALFLCMTPFEAA